MSERRVTEPGDSRSDAPRESLADTTCGTACDTKERAEERAAQIENAEPSAGQPSLVAKKFVVAKKSVAAKKSVVAKKPSLKKRALRRLLQGLVALVVLAIAFDLTLPLFADQLVDVRRFSPYRNSLLITDRHGEGLRLVRPDGEDRRWVNLDTVSPNLTRAILATEDEHFYEHEGVDWFAMVRAVSSWVVPGMRRSGGSTITQQTVKLVYGRPNGLFDKPLELIRALALETLLDKDEILEHYVNRVPFGDRIRGAARASEAYFGTDVSELDEAQGALLAGIPQAPSVLEPRRHHVRSERRFQVVLQRLVAAGELSPQKAGALRFPRIREASTRPWFAPRFVDGLLRRGSWPEHGARLQSSLDLSLQRSTRDILERAVLRFRNRGAQNAAALVVHNASGQVLAYVGAADQDGPGGALDLLRARRQPGSVLKPFFFARFFEEGGSPASLLDDTLSPMTGTGGVLFDVENYDGQERGPVLARRSLAASLNLSAIDLVTQIGPGDAVETLCLFGFARACSAAPDQFGAAIALGGIDVSPAELARAYATLARFGTQVRLESELAQSQHAEVEASAQSSRQSSQSESRETESGESASRAQRPGPAHSLLRPAALALVVNILEDRDARAQAFGRDLESDAGGPFALKTGTSSAWRDAWSAAFDGDLTVVVWLGDPAGNPMHEVSGFEGAAPVAAEILAEARGRLSELSEHDPNLSASPRPHVHLESAPVCAVSGARPGPSCPARMERFEPGRTPTHTCSFHDGAGRLRLPEQFARWAHTSADPLSSDFSSGFSGQALGPLRIAYPAPGSELLLTRGQSPPLRARRGERNVDAHFVIGGDEGADLSNWTDGLSNGPVMIEAHHEGDTARVEVILRFIE